MNRKRQRNRANAGRRRAPKSPSRQVTDVGAVDKALTVAIDQHQAGQLQQAEVLYRQVLSAQPDNPDALHLLGVIAFQVGRHGAAIELIGRAIAGNGKNSDYHQNLGNALQVSGRFDEAIAAYRRALDINPESAQVHSNLGGALKALGRNEESLAACRCALEIDPNFAEAHNNLGNVLRATGQPDIAMVAFRRAIEIKPDFAEAHNNLGNALRAIHAFDDALASFRRALAIRPAYAAAENNMGAALKAMGRLEAAIAAYRRALDVEPNNADARYNLGNALLASDAADEAIAAFRRVVELNPTFAEAHNNLGSALQAQGNIDDAIAAFRAARDIDPDYGDARQNLGMALLLTGDFANGWAEYQWRWRASDFSSPVRGFPQPVWDGSDLAGRTILLHAEQGLGDTIQFARYAPLVAARGGRVVLECSHALAQLMTGVGGVDEVVVSGDLLPAFETHCPLVELARIFGASPGTIPADVPYIEIDPGTAAAWSERFSAVPGLKVGLAWAGNPKHKNDRNRSVALDHFASLTRTRRVSFFSLQVGPRSGDLAHLGGHRIDDLSPLLTDFTQTAGAVGCLDLLITVDTAVAHLAGALGQPTWLLLPSVPDWRWLLERDDSPWYPSMRLYRQGGPGDWEPVIERVEHDLAALAGAADRRRLAQGGR